MLFVPIILGAVSLTAMASGIYYAFSEKTENARCEYQSSVNTYYNNIEHLRQDIQKAKEDTYKCCNNFKVLAELHFQSYKQGDIAYKAKQSVNDIIYQCYNYINETKQKQSALYNQLQDKHISWSDKQNITKELHSLKIVKNNLYETVKNYKDDRDKLLVNLIQFNSETEQLKYFIRDHCGYGGQCWYARLEQRKLDAKNRR